MAKLSKSDIIASLKEMTMLEINELIEEVEKEFGVSAAAVASAAPSAHAEEAAVEQGPTEVSVYLKAVGPSKLAVVKAIQAITGLGLGDSKKLADVVPSLIKEKVSPAAAEEVKAKLVAAGAEVEVK
jgi:large subunit ribosomal protein L7/L12